MVVGSGIDIIEIERVQALKDKWQNRFLNRIFTKKELAYANAKRATAEHLAARIAIKEALIKAFSDNEKKYLGRWKDIEVSNDESGRPYVDLYGNFKQVKKKRKLRQIIISASHTHKYAVASAILTRKSLRDNFSAIFSGWKTSSMLFQIPYHKITFLIKRALKKYLKHKFTRIDMNILRR